MWFAALALSEKLSGSGTNSKKGIKYIEIFKTFLEMCLKSTLTAKELKTV